MSGLSTHVLDTSRGRPAAGIRLSLERLDPETGWRELFVGETDTDGRVGDLFPDGSAEPGTYLIRFDTGSYFAEHGVRAFYPWVDIVFGIADPDEHYHVPLLLSPYGYSTYRGS